MELWLIFTRSHFVCLLEIPKQLFYANKIVIEMLMVSNGKYLGVL